MVSTMNFYFGREAVVSMLGCYAEETSCPASDSNGSSAIERSRLGERTLIVGVLNVTPDSFSDGGKYLDPDRAFARAVELEEEGADIIDIGAESTRPGAARVSEAEELRRLVPGAEAAARQADSSALRRYL